MLALGAMLGLFGASVAGIEFGIAAAAFVLVARIATLIASLRAQRARIAVRVGGSSIAVSDRVDAEAIDPRRSPLRRSASGRDEADDRWRGLASYLAYIRPSC